MQLKRASIITRWETVDLGIFFHQHTFQQRGISKLVDKRELSGRDHRNDSVYEVDHSAFSAVQEAGELAEVRRGDVVVHGVEVAVVRQVERVESKAHVVAFALATVGAEERYAELPVNLDIQGEKCAETLTVRRSHIIL